MPTITPGNRAVRVAPPPPVRRGHLALGHPEGAGGRIEVTSRWIERDGRPWFPVTGEIHYSRTPRARWPEVLGHARAGGLNAVATYIFWQAHETQPGEFHWTGNLDLRAFIEQAAHQGLDVIVRMGPWAHGEARYGGFPDWLIERGLPTRTDDPQYLRLVRRLYAQIVAQLDGLSYAEGGPVIGVQVENELYDQPEHLATLREIAEDLGLRVPIWTATGWGGAQLPENLLPVYSGYADAFWEDSRTDWPDFISARFQYSELRDDPSVGADLRVAFDRPLPSSASDSDARYPFATCELGGGMHVAYHRRPLVTADDVAALAMAKIGSGSIWQGYYMYAGGTQRTGRHGTEQESHATGYPNDVPQLSYDFYAPIGEHGQIRRHHHLVRRQHLWLADEGPQLAQMTTTVGGGSDDSEELRWAVRSDGRSGYVFLTTYQPARRPLQPQRAVQLTVSFEDETVQVPTRPVDVPSGVSVAWPLRRPLGPELMLRSATAQWVTRLATEEGDLVVLCATDGIPVELVLEGEVEVASGGRRTSAEGTTVIEPSQPPGPDCVIALPGVRVLILDGNTAARVYRLDVAGRERLVLADAPVYATAGDLVLRAESARCTVALFPGPEDVRAAGAVTTPLPSEGLWQRWSVSFPEAPQHLTIARDLQPHADAAPGGARGGPLHRLSAPTDYSGAAHVQLDIPDELFTGTAQTMLHVTWTGDAGRAYIGDRLISDHFWHGRSWDIDLTRWRTEVARLGVRLELLPWRSDAGIWVDPSVRDVPDGVRVASVEVVQVLRAVLTVEGVRGAVDRTSTDTEPDRDSPSLRLSSRSNPTDSGILGVN